MALKVIYQGPNGAVAIDEQQNVTVSSNYTVQPTDYIITATGAGSFNITLPSAVPNNGRAIVIKCLTTAAITVTAYTGEFIDTVTSKSLSNGETLDIVSDGIRWIDTVGSTISGTRIIDGTITNTKLSASSVTEAKIGTSAVTETKIANNAVTAAKIATGAVGNDEISTSATPTVNTIYTNNWFRSNGNTGWYNETHGGGIFMEDSDYVKVYNSKAFMPSSGSDTNGIIFPLNPGNGGGDTAFIKYYASQGTEKCTLLIQVENDGDDSIILQRKRFDGTNTFIDMDDNIRSSAPSAQTIIAQTDVIRLWSNTGGGIYSWRGTDNGGNGIHHFSSNVDGYQSLKAYVNANGDYIKSSDIKIKENIEKSRSYLSDILKLNVVTFKYKGSSTQEKNLGLIAQEVELIFPTVVKNVEYQKNLDGLDGKPVNESIKMVAYDVFVPMLITCIQEQQQQIQSLEERIKKLEELIKS
jgi:hypothetical protein